MNILVERLLLGSIPSKPILDMHRLLGGLIINLHLFVIGFREQHSLIKTIKSLDEVIWHLASTQHPYD